MGMAQKKLSEEIVREVLQGTPRELCTKNPMVLSCGGMYLPHTHHSPARYPYQILTTPNNAEPIKVVTAARLSNLLHEVLVKESMN